MTIVRRATVGLAVLAAMSAVASTDKPQIEARADGHRPDLCG